MNSVLQTKSLHKKHYQLGSNHYVELSSVEQEGKWRTTYKTSPCKDTRDTYNDLYSAQDLFNNTFKKSD